MRAYAGTHRIHALHGGPDGHLGAGTGFPGDVADLHLAVGDFGSLQLKQPSYQVGMGPGDLDQGAPVVLADIQHIDPEQLALGIGFAGDLLVGSQNGVGHFVALAHPEDHIPAGGDDPGYGAGQELLGLAGVALIHGSALSLPNTLDDHLLGSLGGDAAKLGNVYGDAHRLAGLDIGVVSPGGIHGDLQGQVLQVVLLYGGLHQVHAQALLAQVYHNIVRGDIPVILPVSAVGVGEGLLQPLHHVIHGNALQLFQLPQAGKNLCPDIYLGFLLHGFCFSRHCASSNQNSTRSRVRATWDFSNVTVSFPASTVIRPSS